MRIALFSEVYWPMVSGVSLTLSRLVDALHARGHVVRVYTCDYPRPAGMPDRPEAVRLPSKPLFIAPDVHTTVARQEEVTADLAAFAPDVVHILTEWTVGRRGLRAARDLDLPVIMSAHTDYERYTKDYGLGWGVPAVWAYLRWFYRFAHRVLAPTRIYERLLNERGVWHTGIWTRGVHADRFSPAFRSEAFRVRVGVGPDGVLVTNVGRMAPEKNIPLLLAAWDALGERKRGAQLVLVGNGLTEPVIRERARPDVHMLGTLHGEALATAYASADIFAFPSTTETFGNVLLEAMASGVAPVVADQGGHLEFAEPGRASLIARANDVGSFADRLAELIASPDRRRALGAEARRVALGRGWDAIFDQLVADYAETIAAKQAGLLVAA